MYNNKLKISNNQDYKPKNIIVASICAGIGSDKQALVNTGISHIAAYFIEKDKYARETYLANHSVKQVFHDLTKVNPLELPTVDLMFVSTPCTSFSMAGKRAGLEDTRGTLVFDALKILQVTKPKYFIFENVKGMVNHDKGNTFKVIKAAFEELDYNIKYDVLNAKHYGAAQNRERLFIVGIRKDIKQDFKFPEPQAVNNCVNNYIEKGADFSNYLFDEVVEKHNPKRYSDIKQIYKIPRLSYQADKRVISSNGISPCLLAGNTKTKFYDAVNGLFRYLTEDELKQIQGFPRDFKFPVSKTQTRKQIGNSIYVGVLEAILKNLVPAEYFSVSHDTAIAA